ncbi:hypothetical protein K8I31_03510, partial [bacterium]|nr:hypothetical protein [bacterium]
QPACSSAEPESRSVFLRSSQASPSAELAYLSAARESLLAFRLKFQASPSEELGCLWAARVLL